MRIHGEKRIRRSTNVPAQKDYRNYEEPLKTDFQNICGYCGKHEMVSHKGMEIDHFVPDTTDPSRECDYTNLVYSCFTCNRKKLGKWPTKSKSEPHDGKVGFVDPATDEYDKHLGRAPNGEIIYHTDVGKYMSIKAFKFNIRPTAEIWKASQLHESLTQLRKKIQAATHEERDLYIEIDSQLSALNDYLFTHKE